MALKAWYRVVTPREDLREGKPLDASEFAVHLDKVRSGDAAPVYREPDLFFRRTFLTQSLTGLAAEVIRRLSGEQTETSAVFNLATQFGGGKTHALTLLYHLAQHGEAARRWQGVDGLLRQAQVPSIPEAKVAVFVGQQFDPRGGDDGTPLRQTPWGEIAWQLGGSDGYQLMEACDQEGRAPGGDTISKLFGLVNRPILILLDELINYVSRFRKSGLGGQLYHFLQNLSEEARGHQRVVLAASIPASELEMTPEDQSDYERFEKLLDRVGKAVMLSAEAETSEIIRRRLFEWDERAVSQNGHVILPREATQACKDYAEWVIQHRLQLPQWFPTDHATETFLATYPFHPMVLSVFERKWRTLPRFQQTRGVLRLLALWVSNTYQQGFKRAHRDPLIDLGSAPLDDPMFRAAMFEQLGEAKLEGMVTTDICGKKDSHAVRLDTEAADTLRKARLHQKVATVVFFESNGGQGQSKMYATLPEVRLAASFPDLDIANVETVLSALAPPDGACYYLDVTRNQYSFSTKANLTKMLADRRASVPSPEIEERVRAEIQSVFAPQHGAGSRSKQGLGASPNAERIFFPERSGQIPDRPVLTLIILSPDQSMQDEAETTSLIESMTKEYGTSARTFKSALIWCVPEGPSMMREEARKLLAWESIQGEESEILDETQRRQLQENLKKAQRDLKESVWRTYKNVLLLGKDNGLRKVDMGLIHSSAADSISALILSRLRQEGDIEESIGPRFLVRNWPPAFTEWSTRSVRDAFFASPQFPRLVDSDAIRDTIARGVSGGLIAYVGQDAKGDYTPCHFSESLAATDIEISEDMFIITKETIEAYLARKKAIEEKTDVIRETDEEDSEEPEVEQPRDDEGEETPEETPEASDTTPRLCWTGEIPPQKWMNFYTKVLAKFAKEKGLTLKLTVEVAPEEGVSKQKVEETKLALRELGLDEELTS